MEIGILALQGAVEPHKKKLLELGATPVEVRVPSDLGRISGLILPGGESSAMVHLAKLNQIWEPLGVFAKTKPIWGVCAGAILLAREVTHPAQPSLNAIDIAVARNAFGRQLDSFIAPLDAGPDWNGPLGVEGVFIRAPRITAVGPHTKVLFRWKGEPVMVREGNAFAATFHPELTDSSVIHEHFLAHCRS